MWLLNSSIGKKVIMSVSGIILILFLLFHVSMNVTAVFSEEAYNSICSLLGANWYAVAASAVLAAIIVIHILYATVLTLQNRKARGNSPYAVSVRPKNVEWASQNMLALGIIVILFLILHLSQFWARMMFAELTGSEYVALGNASVSTHNGAAFILYFFSKWWVMALYLIWYVALWFHLSHGFWSAFQTLGINNRIWFTRWKVIGQIIVSIIFILFAFVSITFYLKGNGLI